MQRREGISTGREQSEERREKAQHFRPARFRGADEAPYQLPRSNCPITKFASIHRQLRIVVLDHVSQRTDLRSRGMRHVVELKLFLNMMAFKPFGKIRHGRDPSTLNLAAQAEVPGDLSVSRDRVNLLCELPGLLPALQIFEYYMFLPFYSPPSSLSTLPSSLFPLRSSPSNGIHKRPLDMVEKHQAGGEDQ